MGTQTTIHTTFSTPTDHEFEMRCEFEAPASRVFEAWTNPTHVPHWMLGPDGWTMPICEIDLRPGGAWRMVWKREDGTQMELSGEYREVSPPQRLVSTERWGEPWPQTVNTLTLTESGGRTHLSNRVRYPSREARDAAMQIGMQQGASRSFERLAEHLRTMK